MKKSSRFLKMTKTASVKDLFHVCQELSIYLGEILQLTNELTSTTPNTMLITHYSQLNEPKTISMNDNPFFEIHLFSTWDLQRLDSDDHQWKSLNALIDPNEYILVTLPNLTYRCSSNQSSSFTIDYIAYNTTDIVSNRNYWLS